MQVTCSSVWCRTDRSKQASQARRAAAMRGIGSASGCGAKVAKRACAPPLEASSATRCCCNLLRQRAEL